MDNEIKAYKNILTILRQVQLKRFALNRIKMLNIIGNRRSIIKKICIMEIENLKLLNLCVKNIYIRILNIIDNYNELGLRPNVFT